MRLYENSDYLIDTHRKRLNERNKIYESYVLKNLFWRLGNEGLKHISSLIILIIVLILFISDGITVGLFLAMSIAALGIYSSFEGLIGIFKSQQTLQFFEFYEKFFNLSDDAEGGETAMSGKYDIEFRDVWFRYPSTEKDILKGVSFHINEGQCCALIGENGEGKSTIVKLLLGLFTPDKGEIYIDGKRLDSYPSNLRTKIFAPVLQDFTRFSITIKENIGVGDIDALDNDDKILTSAKKTRVDEFAESLEQKYDTLLGRDFEGGVDISGGQWQRIALARAFVGDKPIILLDEPTSQLDPMAEARLYNEFTQMVDNKTAVLITHRLGATKITDRILLISEGIIKEDGTHEQLMEQDGIYAKMFNSQKEWYKGEENYE